MFKKSTLNNNKKEIDAKNGLNFLASRVQSTSFQSPDVQASRVQAFRVQASRIPESNFPESECSGVQSPSVQIPSVPASGFPASRPCVQSLVFPLCPKPAAFIDPAEPIWFIKHSCVSKTFSHDSGSVPFLSSHEEQ